MKRKAGILTLICILLISIAFAACADSGIGAEDLQNWQDGTDTVILGEAYNLELEGVRDADGNVYAVYATVKDADGKEVVCNAGKFTAEDLRGYTIEYAAKLGENNTAKRVVTVTVIDRGAPSVRFGAAEKTGREEEPFLLPAAEVSDVSGEIVNPVYELTKDGKPVDYDAENLSFVPESWGTYLWSATAEDSSGNTAVETYEIFIRKPAEPGEWEGFDDEGAYYDMEYSTYVTEKAWHESAYGREGVIEIGFRNIGNYAGLFTVYPKEERNFYGDSQNVTVSMYVEGDGASLPWLNLVSASINTKRITNIRYNQWAEYTFPAGEILTNFAYLQPGADQNYATAVGVVYGDGLKLYIDKIAFTDDPVVCSDTLRDSYSVGEEISLATAITAGGTAFRYSVFLNGNAVAETADKFTPQWQGTYVVRPAVQTPFSGYAAEEFTFTVTGSDRAALNAYDGEIVGGEEYVLPKITVLDAAGSDVTSEYAAKSSVTFVSLAGKREENAIFDPYRRGRYLFEFSGTKADDGYNVVAEVVVNKPAEGTVFDASSNDALSVVSSFYGGTAEKVDAASVPAGYTPGKGVVLFREESGLVDSDVRYNFAPAFDVRYYKENFTHVRAYLYVRSGDADMSAISATFFGKYTAELTLDSWNSVLMNISFLTDAMENCTLYSNANWADGAVQLKPVGGTFVGKSFEVYFGDFVAEKIASEGTLFSAEYESTRGNLSQSSGLFEDYIAAADVPEIKGDYDGTAARFTEGQSSRKYLLSLGHVSVEELAEYDYVSLWFAFQCNTEAESDAATYMAVLGDTNNLVGNYYQANTTLPKNTWVRLYIPIDQLIELRQADETVVLFDFWSEKGSSTMMKFCIGDIVLEKAADDILFSAGDPFTSGNIGIDAGNGISKGETYADASQIEGIAGEYTGAALQFVSDGGAGTKAYYLDIGKTAEELREYSYVKLTFAATPADQTGVTHGCSMGTDSLLGYFKKDSGNIWNLPKNQWIEEQIPVETLIEFMNGESRIKIFALYGENMNQLPSLPSFYIGDVVLVK